MAANLLAVPLVTLLAVPLILGAMLLHLTGPGMVESLLWLAFDRVLALLFWGLRRFTGRLAAAGRPLALDQ